MDKWYFHKVRGSNITLSPENLPETAEVNNPDMKINRVVFSSKPMIRNKVYEIRLEERDERVYQEFARFGVCHHDPSNITVPKTCQYIDSFIGLLILGIRDASGHPEITQDKWIFNADAESINSSNSLGVTVDDSGFLHLYLGDRLLHKVPGIKKEKQYYAVFDLNASLKVSTLPLRNMPA